MKKVMEHCMMIRNILVLLALLSGSAILDAKKSECDAVLYFIKYAKKFYHEALKQILGKCG